MTVVTTIRKKLDNIPQKYLLSGIVVVMVTAAAYFYYTNKHNDAHVLDTEVKMITGWRLTHFALYAIIGFLFPEKIVFWFFVGIMWELVELSLREITGNKWWGNTSDYVTDQVINMLGFVAGAYVYKITNP